MGGLTWLDTRAGDQHGLITRAQLVEAGVSATMVGRWLQRGRLVTAFPAVYRVPGAPVTWEQRLLAAVLAAGDGALASHRSAARLWELLDDDVIEVTVPVESRPRLRGAAAIHRSGDVEDAHVVRRHGVPATTPMRTLVDLGAVAGPALVEDALDKALTARLVTIAGVENELDELARPGRRGAGVLRRILDRRALGASRPDSILEPRMARLLRRYDLPAAAFQHRVVKGGRFVAQVDFAYPNAKLAIEVDGFEAHSSPRALQSDLRRQNDLVGAGWTVLRFTWEDVVRRTAAVAAQIRNSLDICARQAGVDVQRPPAT